MEKKKEISLTKITAKIIPMMFHYCPIITIILLTLSIFHGVSFAVNTVATQKFFDGVTKAVSGNGTINKAIMLAFILGLALIASQILNGVTNFMYGVFENKVAGHLYKKINEKSANIDPIIYEDTELLDSINKAQKGVDGSIGLFIVLTSLFTFYLPYFLFMGVYLFRLDKILAVSLVFIFIPVAFSQLIRVKVFDKLEDEIAPIRREYDYYESCICAREYFKETRILGGFNYFKDIYKDSMDLLGQKVWKAEKKTGLIELCMKLLTLVGYLGVLYLLFRSLLIGNITIGAFSAVFASVGFMISVMEEIICMHIGDLTKELGTIRNFIDFFSLPERGGEDVELSAEDGISLKNVNFIYPSAKDYSLKDISLEISPKEIIAVVGENGAGKSTLVRIITGLYLPTEGAVEFGGIDTRKISAKSIYKHTSGVFQKYQKYKMNLSENITISHMDNDSAELLDISAKKADLDIESETFPEGYDTMLSREFDGTDISGGQWQRVALARGFYKSHNMIILDEPTASIDPVEETKLYEKFADLSKGKTSIIVTHRIGSAKIADRIIVMDEGRIAEIGTHEELINLGGKYSEMYEAQAQWYVRA
ncbi:ABC transporter ATP-binding protein [Clostridium tagluense]|uniref:ABC transporter n=1 Tax=Clostridium tagluense TaxID=360422 RepID=A0A401UUA1_9CLOT|nr:ABC transporter ATP-binding protein [Clostridium tagluense]GCD13028.1 ABC transporter [Clostridium tagluense]